ncbi:hypothetical protein ACHAWX_002665 [Stephanocyclus meneghinianus]
MSPNPTLLTGLGAAFSLFLSGAGAAFATSHASMFAIRHPTTMAMIPVIEAGLLALYGFIIGYLLTRKINAKDIWLLQMDTSACVLDFLWVLRVLQVEWAWE